MRCMKNGSRSIQGQIEFVGWFPNPTVSDDEIDLFSERYAVSGSWRGTPWDGQMRWERDGPQKLS